MKNKELRNLFASLTLSWCLIIPFMTYFSMKKQDINLVVKGKEVSVSTFNNTVEELLKEQNIKFDEDDKISQSLDTSLTDYMNIEFIEVKKVNETEYVDIPFETKTVEDKELEKGKTIVSKEGKKGEKKTVYELVYENDKLISKNLVSTSVSKEPVDKLVKKGTKKEVVVMSRGETTRPSKPNTKPTSNNSSNISSTNTSNSTHLKVVSTAYCTGTVTATGTTPKWGTIAVDPRVIPYGTKVYIPQFNKTFIAEDTGGAIKGNKIDIYMGSRSEAITWGRRSIDIYILK